PRSACCTAATCRMTSGQYRSCSTIFCSPRTCPSIRFSRRRFAAFLSSEVFPIPLYGIRGVAATRASSSPNPALFPPARAVYCFRHVPPPPPRLPLRRPCSRPCPGSGTAICPRPLERDALPADRPLPRRTRHRRHRRPVGAQHLLLRLDRRRCLENHRCRRDLAKRL